MNAEPLSGLALEVFDAVNAHRHRLGLAALAWDPLLAELAVGHSRAMASGRVAFGHAGFRERARAAERVGYSRIAENVARHGSPRAGLAVRALERWLASPEHARNIAGEFQLSGVGAARGADGSIYLTQLFLVR